MILPKVVLHLGTNHESTNLDDKPDTQLVLDISVMGWRIVYRRLCKQYVVHSSLSW